MTIAYGRVSTDKQDEQSQRNIIAGYCAESGLKIDSWKFETISSRRAISERELEKVLGGMVKGDTLIVSESSRLSRGGMIELSSVVQRVKDKGGRLIIVNGLNGSSMAFGQGDKSDINEFILAVIGWGANMERENISIRTKAGLQARKAQGVKLGRPAGKSKLDDMAGIIGKWQGLGMSESLIARNLNCSRTTLREWLKKQAHE